MRKKIVYAIDVIKDDRSVGTFTSTTKPRVESGALVVDCGWEQTHIFGPSEWTYVVVEGASTRSWIGTHSD